MKDGATLLLGYSNVGNKKNKIFERKAFVNSVISEVANLN